MITGADIESVQNTIRTLVLKLEYIFSHATSDDWKEKYVTEMGNFYEINEKLKALGYEAEATK